MNQVSPNQAWLLPRRDVGLWTAAVLVPAVIALGLPLLLLGGGNLSYTMRAMRDGGAGMWLVLLLNLLLPIVLGVLGVLTARGRAVPAAVSVALAGLPLLAGLGFGALGRGKAAAAVLGDSVDPSQKARILAEGFSESLQSHLYGGLVSAALLAVVAVGCAGAVGTIDRARLGRPAGGLWLGAPFASLFMILIPAGISLALRAGAWFLLVPLAAVPVAALAVVSARSVGALFADSPEASRAARTLFVGALAASLALYLLADQGPTRLVGLTFSAIAGESVDPAQKARIFEEGLREAQRDSVIPFVQLILAGVAFLPAVLGSRAARPLGVGSIAALGLGVLVVTAPLGDSLGARALADSMISVFRAPAPPRPTVSDDEPASPEPRGASTSRAGRR